MIWSSVRSCVLVRRRDRELKEERNVFLFVYAANVTSVLQYMNSSLRSITKYTPYQVNIVLDSLLNLFTLGKEYTSLKIYLFYHLVVATMNRKCVSERIIDTMAQDAESDSNESHGGSAGTLLCNALPLVQSCWGGLVSPGRYYPVRDVERSASGD